MLSSNSSKSFAYWISKLDKDVVANLFGSDLSDFLQSSKDFQLVKSVDMQQILLEIPLIGKQYTDISFGYNLKNLCGNSFIGENAAKVLPLFQYLGTLLPDTTNVYVELDTGNRNKIPSVFIDCIGHENIIFDKLWLKGSEPLQWEKAKEIVSNLPDGWQLLYFGFMPGRAEFPIRLIFTRVWDKKTEIICNAQDVKNLLEGIHFKALPESLKTQIMTLNKLGFGDITVSLDLMPNKEFGKIWGLEIFVPDGKTNPEEMLNILPGKKLLESFVDWRLADKRIFELPKCCGIFFPPQDEGDKESQVQVFLNHIKMRWNSDLPLSAKAYFACNNYFR